MPHSNVDRVTAQTVTSDTAIKAAEGYVYWMVIATTSNAAAVQLNDSTDDSGDDVFDITLPANSFIPIIFDPPIHCELGVWLDIGAAGVKVTIGAS